MSAAPTSWPWQRLNQGNANAYEVLATLLEPRAGERWLDVGTGGGGLAFRLARDGAAVVGVDIAEDGLEHARAEAAKQGVSATFEHGDAQELPFEDASFDGVTSAFGVIFAADRKRAASELGRVCRQGGKLGLTLMPLDSRTGSVFSVLARYGGAAAHPATWPDEVYRLLGDAFELEVERRDSPSPPTPFPSWDEALKGFAPLRSVVARLDDDRVAALRTELEGIDRRYAERPASYQIVLGRRR
jgi:SAM-dependent methyltransferase